LSAPEAPVDPSFPTPWAARAFALTVALHERGLFSWREWTEALGAALQGGQSGTDDEAYWRCWLAALEAILARKAVAGSADLQALQQAWREAAAATPHGEPIELR